jgi:hypothetical protein
MVPPVKLVFSLGIEKTQAYNNQVIWLNYGPILLKQEIDLSVKSTAVEKSQQTAEKVHGDLEMRSRVLGLFSEVDRAKALDMEQVNLCEFL